jgi:plastocyanin
MNITRRTLLGVGGFVLSGRRGLALAGAGPAVIVMRGNEDGSKVWFSPAGLHVMPGQTIRWTNHDQGNSHTSTAFHPANDGQALRIPAAAAPWNSDYLLPGESFETVLRVDGVYDYFCVPHQHAGMVARIVVGHPATPALGDVLDGNPLALFPAVSLILAQGRVEAVNDAT